MEQLNEETHRPAKHPVTNGVLREITRSIKKPESVLYAASREDRFS